MRLLQVSTGENDLLDLHPNVSVVAGLDEAAQRRLVDTVVGLSDGSVPSGHGLLEAHGLLFDLSDDMLALLDVNADGLRPVVSSTDLPTGRHDPRARERIGAERAVAELEERLAIAMEDQQRMESGREEAAAALDFARRNSSEAEAGAAERIRLIDELTAQLDQVEERRRQLLEGQAARGHEAEAAQARRREVEGATIDVRTRHQEAAILCSELAGRLDEARLGLDPDAVTEADAAARALEQVEAAVAAERAAEAEPGAATSSFDEPPSERLAAIQTQIEDLEKRLAAFVPTEMFDVANALSHLRSRLDGALVESSAALELAEQLETLDADLAATAGVGTTSADSAAGRARLEHARQALLEAEQAARNPELDRGIVERLELAHAELLEAIEKADARFAGGRARSRVDTARQAEHALLDELGFASYSDYMMGYSLLNVDPDKESALDAARAELSAAEDEWRRIESEVDAELARAERMERRRLLVDEARTLLGRPVAVGIVVDELRALRVPASVPTEMVDTLRRSLDEAGLGVGDEDLSRDELLLLAEAWLSEADHSSDRERELRGEIAALADERLEALTAVEVEQAQQVDDEGPPPEDDRQARLFTAQQALDNADARRRAHLDAEAAVAAVTAELAAAVEAERLAADAAADAEAAVAAAVERAEQLAANVARASDELVELSRTEIDANEHLQSLSDHEYASPEELAKELADAEAAVGAADDRVRVAIRAVEAISLERTEAQGRLRSFEDVAEPIDDSSIAEEIEWYLLARLAAQRSVCLGGSLPLLLNDALDGLDEDQLAHVLGRLERMADAVQVIVVTDDPLAAAWALSAGQDRAAVVRRQPA